MSSPAAYSAFADRLADWETTPVLDENDFWEPPNTPAPFLFFEVWTDVYQQDTTGAPGANKWVEEGTTTIHVMVPSGTGTLQAREYAESVMYLFREQDIGAGLHMPRMTIGEGQPGRDFPNYWSMALSIFWDRDDITSIPTP